jgi:transposase InsO family protein
MSSENPLWGASRIHGELLMLGFEAAQSTVSKYMAMGIRDRPISPGLPWQNGYAERLIGTLRRECLDQVVIFGEIHLRRILSAYAAYYNRARTHLALQKDAPLHRGAIFAIPILAGVHHQYVRI